jgi:hypothetical protein
MSILWNSLYCPSNAAAPIADALRSAFTAVGYELYNPFALSPGSAYRASLRVFVAPPAEGWVRVVGYLDEPVLQMMSESALCLALSLDAALSPVRVYRGGQSVAPADVLTPYLRPGRAANDLSRVLAGEFAAVSQSPPAAASGLPLDLLPDEIQSLAKGVNTGQAQTLFARLSGDVLKKVTGDGTQLEGARGLLHQPTQPDWNTPAGQQIQALMHTLTVPEHWREPDFDALRHAYPLHQRRAHNPNARLYPGDEQLMKAVPNAVDYLPVYGGKN